MAVPKNTGDEEAEWAAVRWTDPQEHPRPVLGGRYRMSGQGPRGKGDMAHGGWGFRTQGQKRLEVCGRTTSVQAKLVLVPLPLMDPRIWRKWEVRTWPWGMRGQLSVTPEFT